MCAGMDGGNQGVLWGNQGRDGFCRGFHCPIVHASTYTCVYVPTSIFNVCVFVCALIQRPGESYFSIFES